MDTGGYSFVYPWMEFMGFFSFLSFFPPSVFLLILIKCLGDVGSSGFWKWREGSKNLLHFVPCSSYNGLLTALFPVPSLLNPVHYMKSWVFFPSPPPLHSSPPHPCLPTATGSSIFHLIDQAHHLATGSDSSILPSQTTWILIFLTLPDLFSRNICGIYTELFTEIGLLIKAISPIKGFF